MTQHPTGSRNHCPSHSISCWGFSNSLIKIRPANSASTMASLRHTYSHWMGGDSTPMEQQHKNSSPDGTWTLHNTNTTTRTFGVVIHTSGCWLSNLFWFTIINRLGNRPFEPVNSDSEVFKSDRKWHLNVTVKWQQSDSKVTAKWRKATTKWL
jgi:hypothetical protein